MTQAVAIPSAATPAPVARAESRALTPPVRLNAFQLLMRRWSKLHPYNAGQVMEVSGEPDPQRWKQAVETILGEMGLGAARFEHGDRVVHFSQPRETAIEKSDQELAQFFCEELNHAFEPGDAPIRFCLLPKERGGRIASHYFAGVYDHWIGDSRAMRELMRRIFERYQQPEALTHLPALTLQAPPFKSLFRRQVGRLTRWASLREGTKNVWRHRDGFRVNIREPLNFKSHLLLRQLPEGLIHNVHRFAKARQASVNDLFIAVLAQTMGAFTQVPRARRRKKRLHFPRTQIGIGTIVDIRDAARDPLDRVFNLYLSSYTVVLDDPETLPVAEVLARTASATSRLKMPIATVKSFWAMAAARFFWDCSPSARYRSQMLHKMVPVVAGISNVKMTGTWVDVPPPSPGAAAGSSCVPQVLDYFRISPTGPLLPLVFTLTTIGNRLSLCVTYRTTAFSEEQAQFLADDFAQRLHALG